ncbi:MAG TPA: hypothetical protein IAC24_02420 [Candidatus Onthousia faecigallinarum]|nr:hypothetical protein [Candidatus Onthousia faecigallinarum]
MTVEDQYRYMISGYLGIREMDDYDLKVYILKEIEEYLYAFMEQNPSNDFSFQEEWDQIEKEVPLYRKLQDALLVLNRIEAPMELVLLVKKRLKELKEEKNDL